jgi:general secretion pathway protein K
MKTTVHPDTSRRGFALIIVMIVVFVLSVLAGGFAYSMRVEMQLARNSLNEAEMEWLGRSGVELARYVLAEQARANEPYDSLDQVWAGGPGINLPDDSPLWDISLEGNELGRGRFSIRITDLERKFNINLANPAFIQQALSIVGADAGDFSTISDSFMDWLDADDDPHLSGAESDWYMGQNPPYYAKNGLIDDLSELLLIRGITPEIYWGLPDLEGSSLIHVNLSMPSGVGLVDLFTVLSAGRINVNTASQAALQMIPGVDEGIAAGIISLRAGLDGVEGNEDDVPFANVGELINVPGVPSELIPVAQQMADVRSRTFEVEVEVEIDSYKRRYISIVRRVSQRELPVLRAYWE